MYNAGMDATQQAEQLKWPRPVPVSEQLPERQFDDDEEGCANTPELRGESFHVLAFETDYEEWGEASYNYVRQEWQFYDDGWHTASEITHWLPMPPAPQ